MTFDRQALSMAALAAGLLLCVITAPAQRAHATASNGACCRANSLGCVTTDSFSCEEGGGVYFGDGTTCDGVTCDQSASVPVFSFLGMVGLSGALAGLGLLRLFRWSANS